MKNLFEVEIAKEYGIEEAILLENIHFWIQKNIANNINFYDGNYWTFNSTKAFSELFPYMTERKIRYALQKLKENGLIVTGNYNKSPYDKTLWYGLTIKAFALLGSDIYGFDENGTPIRQNCRIEIPQVSDGADESVKPIPYINTDINNTDINTDNNIYNVENDKNERVKEIIDYLNLRAKTNFRYKNKETQKHINGRLNDGYTVDDFKNVIDKKCNEWLGTSMEQYLRPSTLFSPTNFENYINQKIVPKRNNNARFNNQQNGSSGNVFFDLLSSGETF